MSERFLGFSEQPERQPVEQGAERLELTSVEERRLRRNYERDQSRAAEEKTRARVIVDNWKGIDAEKTVRLAKQKRQQALREQDLRSRYPDLFPKPNKSA